MAVSFRVNLVAA